MPVRGTVVALAALAVAMTLLVAGCGSDKREPAPVPEGAEAVAIPTEDGLTLDGRLFRAHTERLVILLHMWPASQEAWFDFASQLGARGLTVLTFDFRGFGASDGSKDADRGVTDTLAALDWAHARGYRDVALLGASMGGTAALVVASEVPVDGVVAISAPLTMGSMDAGKAIAEVDAPIVLIAAEGDVAAAESLAELAKDGGLGGDSVLLLAGRAHGTDLLSQDGDSVRTRIFDFLFELWGEAY